MLKRFVSAAVVMSSLTLAGCDVFDDDDDSPLVQTSNLRVLHASSDAPAVDVLVNGAAFVSGADFKDGTALSVVESGTYTVQVNGLTPGSATAVIGPVDLTLEPNTEYTVIAIGNVAEIEPYIITAERSNVTAGNVRATVVHGAANAPTVDIYVTEPGADLAASDALGTLSFGDDPLGPVEVPADEYQISVTLEGEPASIVYQTTAALPAGADIIVTAVDNPLPSLNGAATPSDAPISLVVLDGTGAIELFDVDAGVTFRAIHNAPSVGDVDIIINDDFDNPVEDLPFAGFTGFVPAPAGDYNLKVTPANTPGVIAIDADVTLDIGTEYSVYAIETEDGLTTQVLVDDRRPVATQAKVRIVHGSPTAQDVDIYVTTGSADIDDVDPTFADIPYQAETGYVSLAEGSYFVTVTAAGSKTPAIGPAEIVVVNGGVYTAIARDPSGTNPNLDTLGLILLDDFNL